MPKYTKSITLSLTPQAYEDISRLAQADSRSRSSYLRQLVSAHLRQLSGENTAQTPPPPTI